MNSEWRSIKSVPHVENERVLLGREGYVEAVEWSDGLWWGLGVEPEKYHDSDFTHWQPLPAPPADFAQLAANIAKATEEYWREFGRAAADVIQAQLRK